MKVKTLAGILVAGMFTTSVYADHNSKWGEGWANMPNDIHNTRIDTLDGDNSAFTDFVKYGNGADSVNRFTDTDLTRQSGAFTNHRAMGGIRTGISMGRGGRR